MALTKVSGAMLEENFVINTLNALNFRNTLEAKNYPTLNAAINAAIVNANTLVITTNVRLMASVIATPNIAIEVTTSGLITLDTSRALTVNCSFTAPRQRVFIGSGTVVGLQRAVNLHPAWWGAVGDGVTDDTAAFAALEIARPGHFIDLGNSTFSVTAVPINEDYRNGTFFDATANTTRYVDAGFFQPAPCFHPYGGQLRALKEALGDPLQQIVSIVFIGDSITWGSTTPQSANVNYPSNHAGILSDSRDNEYSPSYVNEFRRYIGREYANGNTSQVSSVVYNWAAAGANGNAITEYTINQVLYPAANIANVEPFVFKSNGISISTQVDLPLGDLSYSGFQCRYGESDGSFGSNVSIVFGPFTGNTFNLIYAAEDTTYMDYTIFANGVNVAANTFASAAFGGDAGVVTNTNYNKRVHSFSYVRNASIELRSRRPSASNTRVIRINAIEIPKKIRITNQGISGSAVRVYLNNCLSGAFAPPRAIGVQDNFVFMQLGVNDRAWVATNPNGVSGMRKNLQPLTNDIKANSNLIIMVSQPVENQDNTVYTFSQQELRDSLMKEAKRIGSDFIDNYAVFPRDKMSFDLWTVDGLHPNVLGHARIYRNIVGALEQA
jgi:hypothetical protein